jgi:hypothetical protein
MVILSSAAASKIAAVTTDVLDLLGVCRIGRFRNAPVVALMVATARSVQRLASVIHRESVRNM